MISLLENLNFLRGQNVTRKKLKLAKVEEAKSWTWKVEFDKSWKREKLKIARVENAKVENFRVENVKNWICEELKIQKLKRQGWKCKVENAEVEPSCSRTT